MYIYQVERDLLQQALRAHADVLRGHVLDVGAGASKRYASFMLGVTRWTTLDIDASAKPDIIGSADAIPTAPASFDGVLCTQVLGDLVHPEKAIAEFHRILKPGGMVIITEGMMNELHDEPRDFWRFTPHGLRALFEEHGFEVAAADRVGGPFTVTFQLWTRFWINVLDLYRRPLLGRLASVFSRVFGKVAAMCDRLFSHPASTKIVLDVVLIARKRN